MRQRKFRAWYPFQQGGGKMLFNHQRMAIHWFKSKGRDVTQVWLDTKNSGYLQFVEEGVIMDAIGHQDKNGV